MKKLFKNRISILLIITPVMFASSISLSANNIEGYTEFEDENISVNITNSISGSFAALGVIISAYVDSGEYKEMWEQEKLKNYELLSSDKDISLYADSIKGKINNALLTRNVVQKVYYKTGSSAVSKKDKFYLQSIIKNIINYRNIKVTLVGNSDPRGSNSYNSRLAELRIDSIKDILLDIGINNKNIKKINNGGTRTIKRVDKEDYFFDRTVDIVLYRG
jgi:outer membrane protein OmpA-like peptidoglycan-associated protein